MNRPPARAGLRQPQRLRAMVVVLVGLSMSVLDGAIANIALPTIAQELRTDDNNRIGWRSLESSWMLLYDNNFSSRISRVLRTNESKCSRPEDSDVLSDTHSGGVHAAKGARDQQAPLCGMASWVSK